MAQAENTVAMTEQPAKQAGLPQLDYTTFSEQVAWLFLTFIVLYIIVSRIALPKVDKVIEERDEKIATDLDKAEKLRIEVDEIKASYEASLTKARANAQKASMETKDAIQGDITKAADELDAKLSKEADEAASKIAAAKADVMADLESVATEVANDLVSKLTGLEADEKSIKAAVAAELSAKGA
ncbi:hypothetical protein QGN29_10600 [Temperatibacter marinus]|uniref:ATP synthase subunit b n=1 Tax=Temperatibacter marinus TaxID=1456591 RepID=A0AA52EBZ5_9PROT|nr:hypothetical protein [Temperatibacter marinus]WND01996.1 hypothetical protein QGN29_10600 [Temperatibacter marinus]